MIDLSIKKIVSLISQSAKNEFEMFSIQIFCMLEVGKLFCSAIAEILLNPLEKLEKATLFQLRKYSSSMYNYLISTAYTCRWSSLK